MVVSEILKIKGNALYTAPPDGRVLDAVTSMAQLDIGSLVVMDRGRMAGLMTFAHVLKALAERVVRWASCVSTTSTTANRWSPCPDST